MFCHGCEGMRGITRRDPFFFFPPSCYGISRGDGEEWERFFFCVPTSASIGWEACDEWCSSPEDNTQERDFTKSQLSSRSSLTNRYQQEQIGNESVGRMILNVTD